MNNFHHGFTTDLHNGLTVSVQFHDGAYANRDDDGNLVSVEIACWKTGSMENAPHPSDIQWLTRDVWADDCKYDDVVGHISVDRVMDFMDRAVQLPTDYVNLLAVQRETANIKQETERLKQESEEIRREMAEENAMMAEEYGVDADCFDAEPSPKS